MFVHVHV